jgi:hypothetical protein
VLAFSSLEVAVMLAGRTDLSPALWSSLLRACLASGVILVMPSYNVVRSLASCCATSGNTLSLSCC